MKAAEVLTRYAAGERDFRGANLRGQNFTGQDLSCANFSQVDIRSTNFAETDLRGCNFSNATAGLQRRWTLVIILFSWLVAAITSYAASFFGAITETVLLLFANWKTIGEEISATFATTDNVELFMMLAALLAIPVSYLLIFILLIEWFSKGTNFFADTDVPANASIFIFFKNTFQKTVRLRGKSLSVAISVLLISTIVIRKLINIFGIENIFVIVKALFLSLSTFSVLAIILPSLLYGFMTVFSVTFSGVVLCIGVGAGIVLFLFAVVVAVVVAVTILQTSLLAATVAVAILVISTYISWRAIKGDPRDTWIISAAIPGFTTLTTLVGTRFCHANLTNACFSQAQLKSTNFRRAIVDRVDWHLSKMLDWSRMEGTILSNPTVRELAVSHRGIKQSYANCNLQGINLVRADLNNADLTDANLSGGMLEDVDLERAIFKGTNLQDIVLQGANLRQCNLSDQNLNGNNLSHCDLSGANLSKAQLFAADLTNAILTGACIQDWQINSETKLSNVQCDFIYRKFNQQTGEYSHRLPADPNSTFAPGEFTKLFQILESALDTINLTFTEGIDWQAFFASFQELKTQRPNEAIAIRRMEDKGAAFVVGFTAKLGADKGAIETEMKQLYQAELKRLEARYEERLRLQSEHLKDVKDALADARQLRDSERQRNTDLARQIESLAAKQGHTYNTFQGNVGSAFNQGSQRNVVGEVGSNLIGEVETLNQQPNAE